MASSKILMSIKILIKKSYFLCINAHACWYTNTPYIFLLPSLLPAFLPSDITAGRLLSCLAIQQGHHSFWSWGYFQENAQVFSYWKKLDLIRDLKTSFSCPWSLWIWLPLCCHCKIKAKIHMFVKRHSFSFVFISIKRLEWHSMASDTEDK